MAEHDPINSQDQINISAVRNFLHSALMLVDVRRICREDVHFAPVLDLVGPNSSLEEVIDALFEYSCTRLLVPDLISVVRECNPRQYERHLPRLFGEYRDQPKTLTVSRNQVEKENNSEPAFSIKTASVKIMITLAPAAFQIVVSIGDAFTIHLARFAE